jgi:hypothetical protein
MFCPEERIPREIFWAGFGFQVWCQMLTHLIQSSGTSLFLIDEPDIYLHSDLQRRLVGLLRNLGPDILIATHSTEIITEAEADDIVLVQKRQRSARRLQDPSQLGQVFTILGSNLNPTLTQLAKTRRAVFVEGKDFQILGRLASKLGLADVAGRNDFAVVSVGGFNPARIRSLKIGMEATLGRSISAFVILDRDYRSDAECDSLTAEIQQFCLSVNVFSRKEIENYLLDAQAIDRAAERRVKDRALRTNERLNYVACASSVLDSVADSGKSHAMAQYVRGRLRFERAGSSRIDESAITEAAIQEFEGRWNRAESHLSMVPGKEAISALNQYLQANYSVSLTPTAIIEAMRADSIPTEMKQLLQELSIFGATTPLDV